MPGWKLLQSKRQETRKTKLAVITLGIVLGLLLLAQAVKLTQAVFSPWKISSQKTFLWTGDFNINLLIRGERIALVSFNPREQKLSYIDIPDSTFLEVNQNFGKWQLSAIYDLGGNELLRTSLSQFFGLPIEAILDFSSQYSKMPTEDLIGELKDTLALVNILPNLKSNLSPFEILKLNRGIAGVRFDKIRRIDLEQLGVLEETRLADGTMVLIADYQRLDSAISDLVDPIVKLEHKTIAVFNATDYPLLASRAARVISNIGGDVIITANSEKRLQKTQIFGEQSRTLERLWQIFGKSGTIDPSLGEQDSSRAQINVYLGEDYASVNF